ncbi:MAG: ATP-binding cassette domain-containing protein [Caldilineaceae bacterium]|nr:ATP-binding cassette domain-containing protein [Caldilineaceae bacterium]HRJ43123.1 ATP-binding cassette domain-containing protein [Caldilineaceae bacterium]
MDNNTVLQVNNLKKYYPVEAGFLKRRVGTVRAVDDVSFAIRQGETVSLVGESGCGKTTTSRCIVRAVDPTEGEILYRRENGEVIDLATIGQNELRPIRREFQMVFQDPFSSLNPRMTIFEIISEPLRVHGIGNQREREDRVADLLKRVGLRAEYMRRFPHAFSGGQRQRIGIARALAASPRLIVADEPVSALDVSVQAQVLNLMMDLQDELGLTYLFVAHDLSVVNQISNTVLVMYVGRVAEIGPPQALFRNPKHPYTAALIASVPKPDPFNLTERVIPEGEIANPANPPSGCYFHPRCPFVVDICKQTAPPLEEIEPGRFVSCHRATEIELMV